MRAGHRRVEKVSQIAGVLCVYLLATGGAVVPPSKAEAQAAAESEQRGFPEMFNLDEKKLADGKFIQWPEDGELHVTIDYDFGAGRRVEEKTSVRQVPRLVQDEWSWTETENGQTVRHFEVDFKSGKAMAEKRVEKGVKHWSVNIKVQPGQTFAGFGFVLALKSARERLVKGEKVELQAVGFTPKPHVIGVDLSYGGLDQMMMGGRIVKGDRFIIHPKVPAIAKVFVAAGDTHIWLTQPPAVGFLRWEGPLVESSDPMVRVDLVSGERSGPATPAAP